MLFRVVEGADGSQLRSDLVCSQRINTAAALPLADLFKRKSESFRADSGIVIQIYSFVLKSTAGEIAVFQSITSLSVRREKNRPVTLFASRWKYR